MTDMIQIKGRSWYINAAETIPVYFLNDNKIVLFDSGTKSLDESLLKSVIEKNNLQVRAVIGTHNHIDHSGNNQYLQRECGAEIIEQYLEAALFADISGIACVYRTMPISEVKEKLSHLVLTADRVYSWADKFVDIDGVVFEIHALPGHTAGHTGIATPDGVLYLGDSLVSEEVLKKSKLLTITNWSEDCKTKEYLRNISYDRYVLAHKGVFNDIVHLIDLNNFRKNEICRDILDCLACRHEWTISEIEAYIWKAFGISAGDSFKQAVFRRNLLFSIEYLVDIGKLKCKFNDGATFYSVSQS